MAAVTEEQIAQLFAVHNGPERRQTLLARQYGFDSTRTWVDDNGYRLSDRVWRSRTAVRRQIDDILRQAVGEGTDALEVAKVLEQYMNPDLAPVRNAAGKLIRNQDRGIVTSAPGRGGMGSFAARRLARTEITRALGQSTIETAKRTPFAVGVRWSLSNRHPKGDECNDNAERSSPGLPRGVYTIGDVPRYPSHPMCLCFLSTETETDTDKIVASLRDKYGLGEGAGTDAAPQTISEITTRLQSMGVANVDLRPSDIKAGRQVFEAISAAFADGTPVPRTVRLIQASDRIIGGKSRVVAAYSASSDALVLNPSKRIWDDAAGHAKAQAEAGWWSSGDALHAVNHEIGHQAHFKTVGSTAFESSNALPVTPLGPDGLPIPRSVVSRQIYEWQVRMGRDISRYAITNRGEFVAEVYAGVRAGNTYSDEVMAVYRAYGGPNVSRAGAGT